MDETAAPSLISALLPWVALAVVFALYALLSVAIGARLAVGRYAAERIADEAGLSGALDPGTRLWISTQVTRQFSLVLVPVLAFVVSSGKYSLAIGAGAATILLGRVAQDLVAPRIPEGLLAALAPLLRAIDLLIGWLMWPLARAHQRIQVSKQRDDAEGDEDRREEQLEEVLRDAEEGGLLERAEGELVREIVDLASVTVVEVMTPRTEVSAVESGATCLETARLMLESMHSRLPVYEETLDRLVGVVSVRDLLPHVIGAEPNLPVKAILRPLPIVPAQKLALELLRELQSERQQIAGVVDEYGGTAGIVTIEDIVEEIVGDIRDEHDLDEEYCRSEGDGVWLADGLMTIEDFEDLVDHEFETEGIETVGGLVFSRLGRIPRVGERVEVAPGIEIEIVDMRSRRIARVRITRRVAVEPRVEAED